VQNIGKEQKLQILDRMTPV
jgi:hypothetical protein